MGVTHDGALLTLAEMTSPYRQTHISLYGHPQRFFSAARPATAVLCWLSCPRHRPHETPDQYRRARPGARHRLLRTGFRADPRAPGPAVAEMSGAQAPIYLLEKAADTPAAGATRQPRDYARHWTPVHLDVVVDDVDAAVTRAVAAGARLEPAATHAWGRIAHLSDPFGHGICLLQFLGRGYDELAEPALRYPAVSKPISRTCWHCASPPCAKAWSSWAVSTPSARAASRAPPSARNTPGQSSWKENASASTRCARTATACAWTTCTCTRRPRPGAWAAAPQAPAGAGPTPGPAAARGRPARQRLEPLLPAPRLRQIEESEWDIEYLRPARKLGANASKPCDGGFAAAMPPRPPPRTEQVGREEDPTKINATTQQDRPNRGRADPAPPVRSQHLGKRAALRGTSTF